MRSPLKQQLHDNIVSIRARELQASGSRVWADVFGFPQPQLVFSYRPDIISINGFKNLISEVETTDTFSSEHTHNQLKAFDQAKNFFLEVVVPESVYDSARRLYTFTWRISVDSWLTFKE